MVQVQSLLRLVHLTHFLWPVSNVHLAFACLHVSQDRTARSLSPAMFAGWAPLALLVPLSLAMSAGWAPLALLASPSLCRQCPLCGLHSLRSLRHRCQLHGLRSLRSLRRHSQIDATYCPIPKTESAKNVHVASSFATHATCANVICSLSGQHQFIPWGPWDLTVPGIFSSYFVLSVLAVCSCFRKGCGSRSLLHGRF